MLSKVQQINDEFGQYSARQPTDTSTIETRSEVKPRFSTEVYTGFGSDIEVVSFAMLAQSACGFLVPGSLLVYHYPVFKKPGYHYTPLTQENCDYASLSLTQNKERSASATLGTAYDIQDDEGYNAFVQSKAPSSSPLDKRSASLKYIDSLAQLKDGWLGEDSEAPKQEYIADARQFLVKLPWGIPEPFIAVASDGEIVFDWLFGSYEATVDFSGGATFGYALCKNGKYVPGEEIGNLLAEKLPSDLIKYLQQLPYDVR